MSMEDSLLSEIKEYSIKDIEQLIKMTESVREHWKTMLADTPCLGPAMKMAIELSIKNADDDLAIMANELAARKK